MSSGATPQEWATFTLLLGLDEDLLPVVSDTSVPISPNSKMKALGKTPSLVNSQGFAVGMPQWTSHVSTPKEIAHWQKDDRLGICLQTRRIRALDIDVEDRALSNHIGRIIQDNLGTLPIRFRANSTKVLYLIELAGDYSKRAFKAEHGIVEFLATGQQCIIAGDHTSGARYEWENLDTIPKVTPEQFEALWTELVDTFAIEPPTHTNTSTKKEVLTNAIQTDPLATFLIENQFVYSAERDGRLHIRCPYEHEHTGESAESSTTYFPANTGGYARGHFACLHAHCAHRTDEDFKSAIGFDDIEWEDLTEVEYGTTDRLDTTNPLRFPFVLMSEVMEEKPKPWIIKKILPQAEVAIIFGLPSSGKSFMALDMAYAITLGHPWKGYRVKQGPVAVIVAEGQGGTGARAKAYELVHGEVPKDNPLHILRASPNFLQKKDVLDVVASLQAVCPRPRLIIVDTWAQVTAGGNENSGEDMGLALSHCKGLHKATGAMVLLVHHAGKNSSMGVRGWSGLQGAADAVMEVVANEDSSVRVMSITKQKEGEAGLEFPFKLNVVTVGYDDDNDEVTSCTIEHLDMSAMNTKKVVQLGKVEQIAVKIAQDLVGLDGTAPDVNSVIDAIIADLPFDPTEGKRDRRAYSADRALKGAIKQGILVEEEGRIYVNS